MSGGSYNYLCLKDSDEICTMKSDIEAMSARLAGLGYAEVAALETEELLLIIRQFENRAQAIALQIIRNLLILEESVKYALEEYRKEHGITRSQI